MLTRFSASNQWQRIFTHPLFISDHDLENVSIPPLPAQFCRSVPIMVEHIDTSVEKGLRSVLLLGSVCDRVQDAVGTAADDLNGPIIRAI